MSYRTLKTLSSNKMKLYITLEDDSGQKIEKVIVPREGTLHFNSIDNIVEEMEDSLLESKKLL